MKHYINIETWERKGTFRHFLGYSNPYFGICTNVDCTQSYAAAKGKGIPFFLYYFYRSLQAANRIPPFRTRLEGDRPVIYDRVNGSPTVLRDDGGLGFALLEYRDTLEAFVPEAEYELRRVKSSPELDASKDYPETIYYSILPWIRFTSVSHPLDLPNTAGIPILTFGKMFREHERHMLPVGIHAHHALMDGMHVHRFLEAFQEGLDSLTV
ncbi:MAG: CatA-like O-acetyltransferase [Candidatus Marinimicrobia bacterium]|nr:CatA-like O-acetyltransferase [Candidatus Neomarinimicrobiota bacterium]